MTAQLVPPSSLPAKSAFFRLCIPLHNRNYAQPPIMRRCLVGCADSPPLFVVPAPGCIALRRAVLSERSASTTLGYLKFPPHVLDDGTAAGGA